MLAARAAGVAQTLAATPSAANSDIIWRPRPRNRATIEAKFIKALMRSIGTIPGNPNPMIAANARGRRTLARRLAHNSVRKSGGLMRRQRRRSGLRMDLGRHHPLGAGSEAHQHILAGAKLGHAETAQRLHVNEDVGRPLAAGQEAEAAEA